MNMLADIASRESNAELKDKISAARALLIADGINQKEEQSNTVQRHEISVMDAREQQAIDNRFEQAKAVFEVYRQAGIISAESGNGHKRNGNGSNHNADD